MISPPTNRFWSAYPSLSSHYTTSMMVHLHLSVSPAAMGHAGCTFLTLLVNEQWCTWYWTPNFVGLSHPWSGAHSSAAVSVGFLARAWNLNFLSSTEFLSKENNVGSHKISALKKILWTGSQPWIYFSNCWSHANQCISLRHIWSKWTKFERHNIMQNRSQDLNTPKYVCLV